MYGSALREPDAAEQVLEAGVGAEGVQARVGLHALQLSSHRSRRDSPPRHGYSATFRPRSFPSTWGMDLISQPGVAMIAATS